MTTKISSGFNSANTVDIYSVQIKLRTDEVLELKDQFVEIEL